MEWRKELEPSILGYYVFYSVFNNSLPLLPIAANKPPPNLNINLFLRILWVGWVVSLFLSPRLTHAVALSWHVWWERGSAGPGMMTGALYPRGFHSRF